MVGCAGVQNYVAQRKDSRAEKSNFSPSLCKCYLLSSQFYRLYLLSTGSCFHLVGNLRFDSLKRMNSIIVIPTFNERDNIRPLVEEIFKVSPDIHILIVDDNSPDGTGKIADALSKEYARIRVLHRGKKEGLGRAYIAGLKEALKMNPDYLIQMDADFSHQPAYIPLLLQEIKDCDIVSGSRFLSGRRPSNVSRLSVLANYYVKWLTRLKVSDTLGGFKCFRRNVIEKIGLGRFISHGFIFQAEFLYRAQKKGFSIHEIPILFTPRKSGLSKKSKNVIMEAFFKTILLRIH